MTDIPNFLLEPVVRAALIEDLAPWGRCDLARGDPGGHARDGGHAVVPAGDRLEPGG